ncbi:MAG: hypothetical protein ACFFD3_04525 [Candidatus Thorarchaeota archaeon]
MGVKNWDFVPWRWVPYDEFRPRSMAIDAPNYLTRRVQAFEYQAKLSIERIPTAQISLAFSTIRSSLAMKILPVFVFDGPPENLKRPSNPSLLQAASLLYHQFSESHNINDARIAEQLVESRALRWYFAVNYLKDLCNAIGVPQVTAPSEAEMMAAVMCRESLVGTVLSNDLDALLFGSPHVTRTIQFGNGLIERCTLKDLQESVDLPLDYLRDLAIICGCDFHRDGVKGVGPRKGVVLLQRYGGLVGLLRSKGYSKSEIEGYVNARSMFEEANYISLNGVITNLNPPLVPKLIHLLEPIIGQENAERQSNHILKLWKDFGKEQTTLEQWV